MFIKISDLRYVCVSQVSQIVLNKENHKISFNFTNSVSKRHKQEDVTLPAFHQIDYADQDIANREFCRFENLLKREFCFTFRDNDGKFDRIIFFDKINSLWLDEFSNDLILNFGTTISENFRYNPKCLIENYYKTTLDDKTLKDFKIFLNEFNIENN